MVLSSNNEESPCYCNQLLTFSFSDNLSALLKNRHRSVMSYRLYITCRIVVFIQFNLRQSYPCSASIHADFQSGFLPARRLLARSLLWQRVRPSVCPSVTLVYCIQRAEDIVKLLSRPGSPMILVFFEHERRYPILRESRRG